VAPRAGQFPFPSRGCKPEPPKIPSTQFQSRDNRIQIDGLTSCGKPIGKSVGRNPCVWPPECKNLSAQHFRSHPVGKEPWRAAKASIRSPISACRASGNRVGCSRCASRPCRAAVDRHSLTAVGIIGATFLGANGNPTKYARATLTIISARAPRVSDRRSWARTRSDVKIEHLDRLVADSRSLAALASTESIGFAFERQRQMARAIRNHPDLCPGSVQSERHYRLHCW
jgi:hypothetical protein